MGLFGLFKKKSDETKVGNVEDFISLTRVYFQSVIATNLGITNIRFLPDVANFKRLFKIPTQGGKLGLAEKSASRKMLMQDYGLNESFFKEIDSSVKRNCRTQNDIQSYLFMYQGFSNDLMMLMGNLMHVCHRAKHFPQQLSGGQQQRVAIARAVVTNPKLILADEPTGNLDSKNGAEVMNLLTELNKEGTTIIMVTHSQHDASFAHRTVHLFDGSVVASVTA